MIGSPKNLFQNEESRQSVPDVQAEADLFELVRSNSDGWSSEDLKTVLCSVQTLKSKKSAARIKAVAKLAAFSRESNLAPIAAKQALGEKDFSKILFELNPAVSLLRQTDTYYVVELAANLRLPKLPLGYGFKGGAARIALAHVIGWNTRQIKARDYDLIRYSQGSQKLDRNLAAKIMPEDFSHGHGVEVVGSLAEYFQSRDLTINEVLFLGKKVLFTSNAFNDLRCGRLKVCQRAKNAESSISSKLACKMIRIAAELICNGMKYELFEFPKNLKVGNFEFELYRKRAAEIGSDVEGKYLELCKELLDCRDLKFANVENYREKKTTPTQKSNRPFFRALSLRTELRRDRRNF